MNKKNNPTKVKLDIPELTEFLCNATFNNYETNKFLDAMYKKYRFNRFVRQKIKTTFDNLHIKYSQHIFFTHYITEKTESFSFKFLIYHLKFNDNLSPNQEMKYKQLLLEKIIKKSKYQVVKKTLSNLLETLRISISEIKNVLEKSEIKKQLTEELDQNEFLIILKYIAQIKISQLISLTENEIKYKDYIISKNPILNLMNYKVEPFIESSQKAFESFKYGRNQRKIILINSK